MGELRESLNLDLSALASQLTAVDQRVRQSESRTERVARRVQATEVSIKRLDENAEAAFKRIGRMGIKFAAGLGVQHFAEASGIESSAFTRIGGDIVGGLLVGNVPGAITAALIGVVREAVSTVKEMKREREAAQKMLDAFRAESARAWADLWHQMRIAREEVQKERAESVKRIEASGEDLYWGIANLRVVR
jgi:hypothetical protein